MTLTTIRFHLAEGALERVGFTYCPRLEAVFSLHVLVEPQRHPLHHGWIRRMRALPVALRRELTTLAFAFGCAPPSVGTMLPDALAFFPEGPFEPFEEGVALLRALPEDKVAGGLADLVAVLKACGDDLRLRALRWIAERPRSTQELAPLVGLSEPALSKHLRQLADAGVLEPRRDGRYVLYHLRRDRLSQLSATLITYLASPSSTGQAEV